MKKQTLKMLITIICVLAAGICYSCSRQAGQISGDRQVLEFSEESDSSLDSEDSSLRHIDAADSELETGAKPAVAFTQAQVCYVHICGEVNAPGVYEMEAGDRIFQAVELAGGFTEAAAEGYLNLAQEIQDGMKIVVPSRDWENQQETRDTDKGMAGQETAKTAAPGIYGPSEGTASSGTGEGNKINLNTAAKEELMTLKGIGQSRAEDIITYREDHGPFQTIEEIMNVSGIKENAFEKIKDDITV